MTWSGSTVRPLRGGIGRRLTGRARPIRCVRPSPAGNGGGVGREMAGGARAGGCGVGDAPVSGGQAGAVTGQLSIMVGGDEAAVAAAEPVLDAYAKAVQHMGGPGAGQLSKMVNQICIAGVVQGLAEAGRFAARAGLDPDLPYQAISQGAAQSRPMD